MVILNIGSSNRGLGAWGFCAYLNCFQHYAHLNRDLWCFFSNLLEPLFIFLPSDVPIALYFVLLYLSPVLNYDSCQSLWYLVNWPVFVCLSRWRNPISLFYYSPRFSEEYLSCVPVAFYIYLLYVRLFLIHFCTICTCLVVDPRFNGSIIFNGCLPLNCYD